MAEERVIKIVVDKKGADKNVKDLNKNLKKTEDSTKELSKSLDKVSGGAVSAFKSLKTGVMSAVKGFKSLRVAIAATGIGLLITAILAVRQAFVSSEEGQNKFAKILGIIGSVTGNLLDILSDLGEKIIWVFENPKQAIKDFANLIKDQIVNRIVGLFEFLPKVGEAISKVFKGEFKEAATVMFDASSKIALGVENMSSKINDATTALKEFGKEVAEDAKKAAAIADQRAKADKIERNLLVERAVANRKIADLRLKAEQRDKFSTLERIKFLEEANRLEDDVTKKEIYSAKLRYDAKVQENALSKSTKEDLDEEARLKANLINLETKKLNLNKRLETRIQALSNEEKAKAKADADRKQKQLDEEEKKRIEKANLEAKNEAERLQKIADIQDEFKKKREDEEAQTVLEKLELEKERKLLELEELKATEEQKADIIKFYDEKINNEKVKNENEANKKREQSARALENAKINLAQNGLSILGQLAQKGSALAKGVAVSQAVISTYQGINKALAETTDVTPTQSLRFANAAAVGIAGLLNVKSILSTNASGTGGANASTPTQQQPSAPSFNLVQGTGANQIAETVSNQNKQPIKAYVVGSEITSQQELDRQTFENRTI